MASHIPGNRNSTPETSNSSLRPPNTRAIGSTPHPLRASADMGAYSSPLINRGIRPASEVYFNQARESQNGGSAEDAMERAAQQWIADIDQYEVTLEEMAAATLDQDFKDELSAIEQWFRVLSEAERTAALYALLQQTTQVQIRFFIQVLQQMAKSHPVSGVLSPANFGQKGTLIYSRKMNRFADLKRPNVTEIERCDEQAQCRGIPHLFRPRTSPTVTWRKAQLWPRPLHDQFYVS